MGIDGLLSMLAMAAEAAIPICLWRMVKQRKREKLLSIPLGTSSAIFALYVCGALYSYIEYAMSDDKAKLMGVAIFIMGFAAYIAAILLALLISLISPWPRSPQRRVAFGVALPAALGVLALLSSLLEKRLFQCCKWNSKEVRVNACPRYS